MSEATKTPKRMYLRGVLVTTLMVLVLGFAANYRCLNEGASPSYINCLSISLILMVSVAFVVLNAMELRMSAPGDPRRMQSCFLIAILGYNTFALTKLKFTEDSTLVVGISIVSLLTLVATVFAIITASSDDHDEEEEGEEEEDKTKVIEGSEYTLVVDEEMQ